MVTERLQVQTLQVLTLWHSTKFTTNTFSYTVAKILKSSFHRLVVKNNIPAGQTVEHGNINAKVMSLIPKSIPSMKM